VSEPNSRAAATGPSPHGHRRWLICALLFAAVVLSYVDRQVLSVLKPTLQKQYGWSETGYGDVVFWFQAAYGVGYLAFGRLVDRIGEKLGYALAVGVWTLGQLAQALVTSPLGFALVRLPLALGESGAFPSALAATAAWFPRRERALAIGLFNAGSNIGAIVTPLIVPAIVLALGWRAAFVFTGLLTVIWLAAWLRYYRRPRQMPGISAQELAYIETDPVEPKREVSWRTLLGARETWAYVLGRFLIDPVWWTFLFWLPDFFTRRFGVNMTAYGPPLIAIYTLADVGSILGGWGSSRLMRRGWSVGAARKAAMAACALVVVPVAFASLAPNLWVAVLLIALASAGHQGFSANVFALPADLFPRWAVGSVAGMGGLSGALGGMLMAKYASHILQTVGSYTPIFAVAGVAYFVALLTIHLLTPSYAPARLPGVAMTPENPVGAPAQ
jgi:ACS family hexuronate transporter-like MFS transporter